MMVLNLIQKKEMLEILVITNELESNLTTFDDSKL